MRRPYWPDMANGDDPATAYAPTHLDVEQWVRAARDAGMQYAVLTAKHVSGFCLWDSKAPWKVRRVGLAPPLLRPDFRWGKPHPTRGPQRG